MNGNIHWLYSWWFHCETILLIMYKILFKILLITIWMKVVWNEVDFLYLIFYNWENMIQTSVTMFVCAIMLPSVIPSSWLMILFKLISSLSLLLGENGKNIFNSNECVLSMKPIFIKTSSANKKMNKNETWRKVSNIDCF